jgi:tRNA-binding EMAP/Myf-like protein
MNEATHASNAGIISFDDFLKVDIRVRTIVGARKNPRALKPAYILEIDFGDFSGRRKRKSRSFLFSSRSARFLMSGTRFAIRGS